MIIWPQQNKAQLNHEPFWLGILYMPTHQQHLDSKDKRVDVD